MPNAEPIDRTAVDKALRTAFPLRFPPALEAAFEAETSPARSRQLVFAGIAAILIYDSFLYSDGQLVPDIMPLAFAVRLGIVTPIAIALSVLLWSNVRPWLRETIATAAGVMAAVSTLLLMLLSNAQYREGQHHTIVLVILFATMVQRVRFAYAVAGCLTCLILHAGALILVGTFPKELWVSANMVLGGETILALIAAYSLERDVRRNYLVSLKERLANSELAVLSRHDPLTGLSNRRSLDELLGEMETGPGEGVELAVLLFDIDEFKLFNDSVGHQGGDVCLKRIAGLIRAELRDQADLAFRFGGEEFLVALPGTSLAGAIAIAERMRRAIEDAAIPHPALTRGSGVVTVSAGAACAILGADLRAAEIIASADAALYAAKRNGRNQVWPPFLNSKRPEVVELAGRKSAAH